MKALGPIIVALLACILGGEVTWMHREEQRDQHKKEAARFIDHVDRLDYWAHQNIDSLAQFRDKDIEGYWTFKRSLNFLAEARRRSDFPDYFSTHWEECYSNLNEANSTLLMIEQQYPERHPERP